MPMHTLVDRTDVVQHFVRLVDFLFQMVEQAMQVIFLYPKCGNAIMGLLEHSPRSDQLRNYWYDRGCGNHTSSGSLNTVAFCRVGRNKSRIEGREGRVVFCWPTTQLSGRRSTWT